jgi:hypothetical protein
MSAIGVPRQLSRAPHGSVVAALQIIPGQPSSLGTAYPEGATLTDQLLGSSDERGASLIALRIAYLTSQLPRVAWYAGHEMVFRQLAADARRRSGKAAGSRVRPRTRQRHQNRIYADMLALLRQDLVNVEAGIYPLPRDHDGSLLTRLYRSWLFFDDLPEVYHRRERNGFREALNETTRDLRPDYYLQNFHFQSGGWMTDESAER